MLFAYFVRYFSKLVSIADLIAKFFAVLKGNAIHHKMIVNIFGVEVGGNDYLKPLAPHPPRRFYTELVGLLRRDLTLRKALKPVVSNVLSSLAEMPLDRHHILIGSKPRAVYARDKH